MHILRHHNSIIFLAFFLLGNCVSAVSHGQTQTETEAPNPPADTLQTHPKKLPARSTWETVAYAPGWLVYAPFRYTLLGLGYLSTYRVDVSWTKQVRDFMVTGDRRRGVLPTYSARGGGGLKFYQRDLVADGTYLSLKATMGIDLRQRYQAHFKEIPLFNKSQTAEILLRYQLLTTESFFGVGPESGVSDRTRYRYEQTIAHVGLSKVWTKYLKMRGTLRYEHTLIMKSRKSDFPSTTDTYSDSVLPGVRTQADLAAAQLEMQFDNTNRPGYPSAGMESMLAGAIFHDVNDNGFRFYKVSADVKRYIHLFYGRILMLRVAGDLTRPIDNKLAPFTYLSELGGATTLRGFLRGRFHDRDMLMGSLEYRYPIWEPMGRVLDAAIFADFGQVSDDIFSNATIHDVQAGYGGGFRFYGPRGLIAKVEVGVSGETTRFYLKLN